MRGTTKIKRHKVEVIRFTKGFHFLLKILTYAISAKISLLSTAAQSLVKSIILRLQYSLCQEVLGLFYGVRPVLFPASGNENLHKEMISILLII